MNVTGDILRRMPYSMEAEQSVLGAVLVSPALMPRAAQMLRPSDFYLRQNAEVYEAMYEMFTASETIDVVTVLEKMKALGTYAEETTSAYLVTLAEFVPATANMEKYASIVLDKSLTRQLIAAATDIAESCYAEADAFPALLDRGEQLLFELRGGRSTGEIRPIAEIVDEAYLRLSELAQLGGKLSGISCGYHRIDKLVGGLNKSDLILLAARPGVGKTAFALNIARHVAVTEKKPVAIFSLEMSDVQLVFRMFSNEASIDGSRLRVGDIATGSEEWAALAEAADILGSSHMKIDDSAGTTVAEMKGKLRRERELGLVIVDYLQLMRSGTRTDNRTQEVAEISRSLKIMAKELGVPILALSQLNRSPEARKDKKPMLSDLRESGSIEQDADIVMFLYHDEDNPEEKGLIHCSVAKNRHGATGIVDFGWRGEYTRFTELEKNREES